MSITAKALCNSKVEFGEGPHRLATISFCPDYQNGRNSEWASSTPHLDIRMTVRGDIAGQFEMGQKYTLTFIPDEEA